jgi:hypothetical protein
MFCTSTVRTWHVADHGECQLSGIEFSSLTRSFWRIPEVHLTKLVA